AGVGIPSPEEMPTGLFIPICEIHLFRAAAPGEGQKQPLTLDSCSSSIFSPCPQGGHRGSIAAAGAAQRLRDTGTPGAVTHRGTAGHGRQTKGTATHGSHLLPEGTPTPLIPALILMETMRLIIRPLALGVRPTLISTAPTAWFSTISAVSLLTLLTVFLLTILEVAVAIIQACVFVLLLSLYLEENI
uniref:ATP synthase F(0) complex subunit a n=1 Tax=Junco hyemalis TaxID=40217 RepID=A0A8C5JSA1_JUNHY